MPSYIVRNENYRDEVLKYSYPFDERSTLQNDEVFIGTDLFLDAIIYLKQPADLPLHISSIDGTFGEPSDVLFLISDNTGAIVARSAVNYDTCTADILNNQDVSVGLFVMFPAALQRFIGQVSGKFLDLLPDVATFSLDVTHVTKTPHLRYVSVADIAIGGDVQIVARHGVYFAVSDEGVLSLNIVGDPVSTLFGSRPIKSINGVKNQSIWLEGHPRANLRISSADGAINFIAARDAT